MDIIGKRVNEIMLLDEHFNKNTEKEKEKVTSNPPSTQ